jgi:hypothetical protein
MLRETMTDAVVESGLGATNGDAAEDEAEGETGAAPLATDVGVAPSPLPDVFDAAALAETVVESVMGGLVDADGDTLGDAPEERLAVGEHVLDGVALEVALPVPEPLADSVAVPVAEVEEERVCVLE